MTLVREYPWHALPRVARDGARRLARARRALEGLGVLGRAALAGAIQELAGTEAALSIRTWGRARRPPGAVETVVALGNDGPRVGLSIEPSGATALLARALGRPLSLSHPEQGLQSSLHGALAALCVELCRRVSNVPVSLSVPPEAAEPIELEGALLVEGRSYAVALRVWADVPEAPEAPALERLGDVRVTLPCVVALSWARRADIDSLRPRDAWLPGEGWLIDRALGGAGIVAAPTAERGARVTFSPDGTAVLREGSAEVAADVASEARAESMAASEASSTLSEVVAEAPVVVRVELGSVSLSLREASALRAGDVLEMGQRIGEPVALRVAGKVIARGDLVDVEGELGVRIRELVEREP